MKYSEEQQAFFRDLIGYLKVLKKEVLTEEYYTRARFLAGPGKADIERKQARAGRAFLTMPSRTLSKLAFLLTVVTSTCQ